MILHLNALHVAGQNWSKTMTKFALTLAAIASVAAGAAFAQDAPMVKDADGDGAFSMEEVVAAYPAVTEEVYKAADIDGNGSLSVDELKAAVDAGSFKTM